MTNNDDQRDFWDGQTAWVTKQTVMDQTIAPVLDLVLDRATLKPGQSVLDIGCGTGASLLALSKAVGHDGRVLGVDIAASLLALAADRTKENQNVTIKNADAAEGDLEGPHDVMVSRFGVMFFNDTTAAFKNIRSALKPGAPLTFATWASPPDNPYFMQPAKAAQAVLGAVPKSDRTLPGPFAMDNPERIIPMLQNAGLSEVTCNPVPVTLTPPGTIYDFAELVTSIGPPAGIIAHHEASAEGIAAVKKAVADEMAEYDTEAGMKVPALINLYTAFA